MKPTIETLEISMEELEDLLERTRQGPLQDEDYRKLKAAVHTLEYLSELLADKQTTIHQLRKLLLGAATSEKTREVLEQAGLQTPDGTPDSQGSTETAKGKRKKGHGRNGAAAFTGATTVEIQHQRLKAGNLCPECQKGKVYPLKEPQVLVRVAGQAPLQATIYHLETLRCNLCGQLYPAETPDGVGEDKYDESAASMIAQLKYGSGVPFYRLEGLQQNLKMPLPASTQWDIVEETAEVLAPVYEELIRQAAQGEVFHNDDTSMKILRFRREQDDGRTGVFTSGIVVLVASGEKIALFFSGGKHAGENLEEVLRKRAAQLGPAIQMCDALARNVPKLGEGVELLLANCLAHGRRQVVQVAHSFPQECRYVLEHLGKVYGYDAVAREQGLSPKERLRFHQEQSGPLMELLHQWLTAQLAEKKTEPNSRLGKAIQYLLNHWRPLSLFLRKEGAPLDNNLVERALKKAILHRKNSLFYRTMNGAQVGDLFMSLIHTCELNDVNPFDYLTELQKHASVLGKNPVAWMPWNYQQSLQAASPSQDPAYV